MEATRTFEKPEILVPVRCDIHPWMRAFLAVLPHPFHAVTGPDGTFTIPNISAADLFGPNGPGSRPADGQLPSPTTLTALVKDSSSFVVSPVPPG